MAVDDDDDLPPLSRRENKRQRSVRPEAQDVLRLARVIWSRAPDKARSTQTEDHDFREHFGCGVLVALSLWGLLLTTASLPDGGTLEQLLWTLLFMKTYAKQKTLCSLCGGIDPQTFQKWVKLFVDAISSLEPNVVRNNQDRTFACHRIFMLSLFLLFLLQIVWENRFKSDVGNDCLMTVDGTDFRIPEHGKVFYSHKFKKSGLRYEVGLCIATGDIVWLNGPYECGRWPDISIFRDSLLSHLAPAERIEADDHGYFGEHPLHVKCPAGFANPESTLFMQQRARNRQETVNKRFKDWGLLKQVYRHEIAGHGVAFRAIAVITQLAINGGEALFECGYQDPPYDNNDDDDNDL